MSYRLKQIEENGPKLLVAIYRAANGSSLNSIDLLKLAGILGYGEKDALVTAMWLRHNGWLELVTKDTARLTTEGCNAVKRHLNQGVDLPTGNTITISNSTIANSNIQNATTNSSQSILLKTNEIAEVSNLVKSIQEFLKSNDLRLEDKEDVECELKKIESQTKSSTPNRERVKGCLTTIKNVIEASSAGAFIVAKIMNFLPTLS